MLIWCIHVKENTELFAKKLFWATIIVEFIYILITFRFTVKLNCFSCLSNWIEPSKMVSVTASYFSLCSNEDYQHKISVFGQVTSMRIFIMHNNVISRTGEGSRSFDLFGINWNLIPINFTSLFFSIHPVKTVKKGLFLERNLASRLCSNWWWPFIASKNYCLSNQKLQIIQRMEIIHILRDPKLSTLRMFDAMRIFAEFAQFLFLSSGIGLINSIFFLF